MSNVLFEIFRWPDNLEKQAEALQNQERYGDAIHDLLSLTATPFRYQIVPDLSTTLLLGLNHANSINRLAAVRCLIKKIKEKDQVRLVGIINNSVDDLKTKDYDEISVLKFVNFD